MEIFRVKTDIPFMKFRKISAIISTSIFIASILFLVTRGLNLGVDFTGGTLMEVSYPQAANLEEIRSTLKKIDLPEAQVQNFGTSSDVLIRLPVVENLSLADLSEKIALTLKESDPALEIERVESVGSQVGDELYEDNNRLINRVS